MSMTEEDVKKLAKEVGDVDLSDPVVVQYYEASLEANKVAEKRLRANFILQRALRNDTEMKKVGDALEKTRDVIKEVEKLLAKCEKIKKKNQASSEVPETS